MDGELEKLMDLDNLMDFEEQVDFYVHLSESDFQEAVLELENYINRAYEAIEAAQSYRKMRGAKGH